MGNKKHGSWKFSNKPFKHFCCTASDASEVFNNFMSLNRIICRLFAAWSFYILGTFIGNQESFNLAFNQTESPFNAILRIGFGFAIMSVVARIEKRCNTDSYFLLAGSTICIMIWSTMSPLGDSRFLFWLSIGIVYTLFLIWIVYENEKLLEKIQPDKKTIILAGILLSTASFFILSLITCLRYKTFSSPNFDFGIFVNMFHNMKETGLPLVTCERDMLLSHFAVHISPVYYLLLPFYLIFPSPYTLQIGQAALLMLGVIPIIFISRHYRLSSKTTIVMSALYVFYTALSTGCFYDIHENCFLSLLLLLIFLFFEKGKSVPMYLCVILTLCIKEDAAIYLIVFAIYIFLSRKNYLHGVAIAIMSIVYFSACAFFLERYGLGMIIGRYENLIFNSEDGLLGIIKTMLLNPSYLLTQLFSTSGSDFKKVIYLLELLLPLGFMPFFTKKASRWILLTPLLINLLTMYPYQYDIGFQYSFGITAFLFYASIQNIAEISQQARKIIITAALAFSITLYGVMVLPQLGNYIKENEENGKTYERMEEILDMIPDDASVSCSSFLLPHIADRREIYEVEYHEGKGDIDYVILDARYDSYKTHMLSYLEQGYKEFFYEKDMIMILIRQDMILE